MAGGNDYRDMAASIDVLDQGIITLSTTQKALWDVKRTLITGSMWKVGKTFKLTACIKLITDGTSGNYVFGAGLGTGDAPAVIVVGPSVAGTVSQTLVAVMEAYCTCRTLGASATVSIWGECRASVGIIASTLQPYIFPQAGATVVSTFDASLNTLALTFQAQRSGAGVWTATCVGVPLLEALN